MIHYLLIMHNDVEKETNENDWGNYIAKLKQNGNFGGGSSVGKGVSFKKDNVSETTSHWIGGYIIINANDFVHAKSLVAGNPVLLAGGTVELRELPTDE